MPSHSSFHGDRALAELRRVVEARLDACAVLLTGEIRAVLSTAGTAKADRSFRRTGVIGAAGKLYRKGRRIYGAKRSLPGQPPFKQTGHLRKSVGWEKTTGTGNPSVRIGSTARYSKFLELGTRRMASRPFLLPTVMKNWGRLKAILERGEVASP